jgi:hypothetical protein
VLVDAHPKRLEPGALGDQPVLWPPGILQRDSLHPTVCQGPAEQREALREASADRLETP